MRGVLMGAVSLESVESVVAKSCSTVSEPAAELWRDGMSRHEHGGVS